MSKEAMTLALKALKHIHPSPLTSFYTIGDRDKAIKALEEALAKQEQGEPVAVIVEKTDSSRITGADFGVGCSDGFIKYSYKTAQFYPTGEKTITNFDVTWNEVLEAGTLLYTTPQPAQKPWVGLTDDEVEIIVENRRAAHWEFIRQVEAKLKEKNT